MAVMIVLPKILLMYWLVLFGATLVCVHLYTRLLSRRARSMLAHLPSYRTLPFIGNMYKFFGDGQNTLRYINEISDIIEDTNLPFLVWVGQRCFIFVSDPEEARVIANTLIEKPNFYNFARLWLGDGLVTAPGWMWKRNVKKLAVAFNGVMVDDFLPIFNEQAYKLVDKLKAELNCEPFNLLHKYLAYTTLEAICQTALGEHNVTDGIITKEYYDAFNRILELLFNRAINIFVHPDTVYRLTPGYREMKRCVKVIHDVSDAILKKRRREIEETKTTNILDTTKKEPEQVTYKAYLDILLEMSETDNNLSEQQIKSEVDTIILGGQETVATALNYIFLMLGCKPEIQRKLHEEIKEIFGESRRPVAKDDLARLPYCEAVIYETLRLLPPIPGVLRQADRDVKLKSCTIPEGATCYINFWGSGRSRRIWGPDALQYRPERWLDPNFSIGASALLSFSIGKRACIGKRYALSLMKTTIVHCLRDFEFISEAEKMALKIDMAVRPVSGHLLQVRSRNGAI